MTDRPLIKWTDIAGIAAHLGLHEATIRRYIRTKGLPAVRIGGAGPYRFDPVAVDAWVNGTASHAA